MGFIATSRALKTPYDGSDCSGVDGALNRLLTHNKSMLSNSLVVVGRAVLHETEDYTTAANVITFLINIDNTDKIMVVD